MQDFTCPGLKLLWFSKSQVKGWWCGLAARIYEDKVHSVTSAVYLNFII